MKQIIKTAKILAIAILFVQIFSLFQIQTNAIQSTQNNFFGTDDYITTVINEPIIIDFLDNDVTINDNTELFLCNRSGAPITGTIPSRHGQFTLIPPSTGFPLQRLKYEPTPGYIGEDKFSLPNSNFNLEYYNVCTNRPGSGTPFTLLQNTLNAFAQGILSQNRPAIIVTINQNQPPLVTTFPVSTIGPYTFTLTDFPTRFFDPEGKPLKNLRIDSLPTHGNLVLGSTPVTPGQVIPYASTNTLKYTPNVAYTGPDTFDWNASDDLNQYANTNAKVNFAVSTAAPVNQNPIAVNDPLNLSQGGTSTVNVLTNDSDPDGNPITVCSFTQPLHGTVTDSGGGVLKYTSNDPTFIGPDPFTYTICDGNNGTGTATVNTILIQIENIEIQIFKDRTNESTNINEPLTVQADVFNPNNSFIANSEAIYEVDATKLNIVPNSAQIGVISGNKFSKFLGPIQANAQTVPNITFNYLSATKLKVTYPYLSAGSKFSITFKVTPLVLGSANINAIGSIPRLGLTSTDQIGVTLANTPQVLVRTGGDFIKQYWIYILAFIITTTALASLYKKNSK
jgi:Bacterial Ig domain